MMRRFLLPFLALVLGAASCEADVRLARGCRDSEVRVTPTPSGPWTPVDGLGPDVLNPDGDVEGDGAPAVARSEGGWLVAWSSPSRASLSLARAIDGWQPITMVAAPDAVGTPLVVPVEGGWMVATRTADGGVSVAGCAGGPGGRVSALIPLGEGRLVGGRRSNGDAQFVVVGGDGCLEIICVRMVVPDPQPIDVYRHVVCLPPPDGRQPGPLVPPGWRLPPGGGCGGRIAPPPPDDEEPPDDDEGCDDRDDRDGRDCGDGSRTRQAPVGRLPRMRLQDVVLPDGSTTGLLTWTSGDHEGSLDLSPDGPMLPVIRSSAEPRERRSR